MTIHLWTESFVRARSLAKSELDRRAIDICEAWILWADPFNVAPDAALVGRLGTADASAAAVIVRQITGKLVRDCPLQMPIPIPAGIAELLDGTTGAELAPVPGRAHGQIPFP
ncbi:hypothetical protein C4375_08480 [Devosia sp. I507]|nr:hypothetical protein C4375_08480 [Devosia sp. I507]